MRFHYSITEIFHELSQSLKLAGPLIVSEVIYALSGFIATIMIAHLGRDELAANALVWGIFLVVLLFFIGVLNAVSILVAQSTGARDPHGVGASFRQGLILSLLFAIPMMLIMWLSPIILPWTGQDPTVIQVAKPFFYALIWCMLPLNTMVLIQQFLVGIAEARLVMWMSIIQVPFEVFFYYIFIFGKLGFPRLGLAGLGYGLLMSYTVISLIFGSYLFFSKRFQHYELFKKWWHIEPKFLKEILHIGWPLGFVFCVELALFGAVAIMMGALSVTDLSAYQITYQYYMIALTIIFALSATATVRVGTEVGQQNREKIKLAVWVNIGMALSIMLIFSVLFSVFPHWLISIDVNIHAQKLLPMIDQAKRFLSIAAVLILADSFRITSLGALRGLKDTRFLIIASIIGFWCIAFPLAYLFAFPLHIGSIGIWWAMVIGLTVAGIILITRFIKIVEKTDIETMVTR